MCYRRAKKCYEHVEGTSTESESYILKNEAFFDQWKRKWIDELVSRWVNGEVNECVNEFMDS